MIRLRKSAKPQILVEKGDIWRDELLACYRKKEDPPEALKNAYNTDEIKTALEAETRSKCMYCEGRIKALGYNHIEHYKPKAKDKYPQFAYEWTNLGIACVACNTNKGTAFSEACPYVNPYVDEPSDFFFASGSAIHPKNADPRAETTEIKLQLNRKELVDERHEVLTALARLIGKYHAAQDALHKAALRDQVWRECSEEKSFSMARLALVKLANVP